MDQLNREHFCLHRFCYNLFVVQALFGAECLKSIRRGRIEIFARWRFASKWWWTEPPVIFQSDRLLTWRCSSRFRYVFNQKFYFYLIRESTVMFVNLAQGKWRKMISRRAECLPVRRKRDWINSNPSCINRFAFDKNVSDAHLAARNSARMMSPIRKYTKSHFTRESKVGSFGLPRLSGGGGCDISGSEAS